MDIMLMKKLGNMDQLCGIRECTLSNGMAQGIKAAEFHNAAGLRFTVVPDRCMDIYDMSYKGINLSFLSRNGLYSPLAHTALDREFSQQWSGGMLTTCGLDNVGGSCTGNINYPTHGRIPAIPADHFGTDITRDGDDMILTAAGEVHQARLYGAHLELKRKLTTTMYGKSVVINDVITNLDAADEPVMLLYHCNFGYPLLNEGCTVWTTEDKVTPLNDLSKDPSNMIAPIDGRGEELYLHEMKTETAVGLLRNDALGLAGYVRSDTKYLPNMMEWKMMKTHDYVLAFEPCNTYSINRFQADEAGKLAILPAYSAMTTRVEIGVLEGDEIDAFIKANNLKESTL